MSPVQIGEILGSFVESLLLAVIWLIICKIIPPLRSKIGVSYGIAIALALVPLFITVTPAGPNISGFVGTLLCVGLLILQYKRAKNKMLKSVSSGRDQISTFDTSIVKSRNLMKNKGVFQTIIFLLSFFGLVVSFIVANLTFPDIIDFLDSPDPPSASDFPFTIETILFYTFFFISIISVFINFISMIIDAVKKQRILWVIVMVFVGFPASWAYFLFVYKKRLPDPSSN